MTDKKKSDVALGICVTLLCVSVLVNSWLASNLWGVYKTAVEREYAHWEHPDGSPFGWFTWNDEDE